VEVPVVVPHVKESPELLATLRGHGAAVGKVAFAPGGKTPASATIEEVKLWDVARRKERVTLHSDLGNSYGLAFSPDGKTLAVAHTRWDQKHTRVSGGIVLWDVVAGKEKARLKPSPPRGVYQVAFSPDGKTIAAFEGRRDEDKKELHNEIALWDVATGKVRATIPQPGGGSGLTFSPDGKTLALSVLIHEGRRWVGSEVRRWDAATGKELPAWPNPRGHKQWCMALCFSPDGRLLAGCDYEGHLVLWDAEKGGVRGSWQVEKKRPLMSVSFSPDGRTLAVATGTRNPRYPEPGPVILWDVRAGRRAATLTGHTGEALCVAFSPDGKTLASGGADRTVRLWDLTRAASTAARARRP
jgi:WD40 repeat protein